jgi:hypothetical protein
VGGGREGALIGPTACNPREEQKQTCRVSPQMRVLVPRCSLWVWACLYDRGCRTGPAPGLGCGKLWKRQSIQTQTQTRNARTTLRRKEKKLGPGSLVRRLIRKNGE